MYRKLISVLLLIAFLLSLTAGSFGINSRASAVENYANNITEKKVYCTATLADDFADDRILVKLSNSASLSKWDYTTKDFPEIRCAKVTNLIASSCKIMKAKLESASSRGVSISQAVTADATIATYNQVLCIELEEPGKQNVLDVIRILETREDVLCAEPDYTLSLCATAPNDPYLWNQWAVSNMRLNSAWDITTGSSSVVVGVIDSGIDSSHPDLQNVVDVEASIFIPKDIEEDIDTNLSYTEDDNGHGTHVAGIIAAQGNNSVGISGVAWNLSLVSIAIFDEYGRGNASQLVRALDYAVEAEIPILNFSGGFNFDTSDEDSDDYHNHSAISEALGRYFQAGGLLVCSAGNENVNNDSTLDIHSPSDLIFNEIISVGAINSSNERWYNPSSGKGSNYGRTSVDIFAPGELIFSCYPTALCYGYCGSSLHGTNVCGGEHYPDYHYMSGTSMATPFVTGVAALIKAEYPNLTASQIKQRIMQGVMPVSGLSNLCVSGGKLDAYRALHDHTYTSYTQNNSSLHTAQCSCGATVKENHSYSSYSQNTSTNHIAYCVCGYSTTQNHSFSPSGSGYRCKCGYYTPFIETNTLIVTPETE